MEQTKGFQGYLRPANSNNHLLLCEPTEQWKVPHLDLYGPVPNYSKLTAAFVANGELRLLTKGSSWLIRLFKLEKSFVSKQKRSLISL